MRKVRGILSGILIAVPVALFVLIWLHGIREVALAAGIGVGTAVALVVGTRPDAHEAAADEAWRRAAPDLPPVSDRIALEAVQASMPGPRSTGRPSLQPARARPSTPTPDPRPGGVDAQAPGSAEIRPRTRPSMLSVRPEAHGSERGSELDGSGTL